MKLLVINGPNLNLLGLREPAIYGSQNYEALLALIRTACDAEGIEVGFVQSNHEGTIVDAIQAAYGVYDGIIINPAAYTHTSIAILDALKAVAIPAVEVHISDVDSREPFRQVSYAGMACVKTYKGLGLQGYVEAVSLGDQTWTGEAFRSLLHFPSSCFWMKADGTTKTDKAGAGGNTDNRLTITIKGVGHGFGISLYTADRRIREGTPWQDIFSCFYKNAQCITIP